MTEHGAAAMHAPFRADHVGSLLRPDWLAEARAQCQRGDIDAAALAATEDRAIREAVRQQEAIGLHSITDGEFRRDWWHLDFLAQLDGVTLQHNAGPKFRFSGQAEQPPIASVTGRIACTRPIMAEHFAFLKSVTTRTPKMTIPSPSMLHLRGGRAAISAEVYPDLAVFWADVAAAYRVAIGHLAAAGCRYLQLDDITFAYLCDPKIQANCRANGDDPEALPKIYADTINAALVDKPADMRVTIHTCRGNFKSAWVAEGGYGPVVEAMFSTNVDGYFMEFDSARAGGFEPLKALPKGKKVVLGLVTTKLGELESKDDLKRRIDEAARHVALDDLCLSPQCGFSSTHHGNALSQDDQWRKLERVVEVAAEVWGSGPAAPSEAGSAQGDVAHAQVIQPLTSDPAAVQPVAVAPADLSPAACAARLAELFPAVFSAGASRPLKLRIQGDIQQRAPGSFTRKLLSSFLHRHTTSTAYLKAIVGAPHRFDLDGQPAGELATEHREAAVAELDRRRSMHDARRSAEREAQRATEREAQRLAQEQARRARAAGDDERRELAALLRAFETTTLTRANFCALKGLSETELDAKLTLARQAPPVERPQALPPERGPRPTHAESPRHRPDPSHRPPHKAPHKPAR